MDGKNILDVLLGLFAEQEDLEISYFFEEKCFNELTCCLGKIS